MTASQDDNRPHTVIVGAGIAGCTLAYELSKTGAGVSLLEAGILGEQGASAVPVALLNPHRGRTARASELDKAGLAAIRTLTDELAALRLEHGVHFSGVLRIASNSKQAKKWQSLSGARWLSPSEIPAPYHAPFGGLLVEKGGWLEPQKLLAALVSAATARGLNFVERCHVDKVTRVAEGLRVATTRGAFSARTVVLSVGASQQIGAAWPELGRFAGDVIGLETNVQLPRPIAGAIYGVQKGRTVFIGGNHRPENAKDPAAAGRLRKSSSWFIKALKEATLSSRWTGVRAKREDNQPLICELEPGLWFYGALGGRGFLCSAYLSRLLAQQLGTL